MLMLKAGVTGHTRTVERQAVCIKIQAIRIERAIDDTELVLKTRALTVRVGHGSNAGPILRTLRAWGGADRREPIVFVNGQSLKTHDYVTTFDSDKQGMRVGQPSHYEGSLGGIKH